MDCLAEGADMCAGPFRSRQHLESAEGCSFRVILRLDAIAPALLADMLAQQLTGAGIEQAHEEIVPLHVDQAPDPAGRCSVVGSLDFYAAVQMHGAPAVLVITKGFERQRLQCRFFFANMAATCRLVVP